MTTVASFRVPGFGQVDVVEQTDAGERFWDLFASSGECLSEDDPFRRNPTQHEVEEFLAPKLDGILSRLEKECERNRIGQEELDEAVHEASQTINARLNQVAEGQRQERLISTAEEAATRINNGGRRHQLAFLFAVYGEAAAVEVLRKAEE